LSCLSSHTLLTFDNKEAAVPVHVVDHPLIKHKLAFLREHNVTTKDFRDLACELANLLTYEATQHLETEGETIQFSISYRLPK
jgi:uracil phosphoribosyltransferase